MTFTAYWLRVVKVNPKLQEAGTMRISVESFQRAMQRAYDQGVRDGKDGSHDVDTLLGMMGMKK